MPYASRRRRSRKPRSRYQNYSAGLGQLKKDVTSLKNMINVEYKFLDTELAADTSILNASHNVSYVSLCSQGDGVSNRDGQSYRIKSLELRHRFKIHDSSVATTIRYFIGLQTQVKNQQLTGIDILETATNPYDPRNLDNRHNLMILKEGMITLSQDKPSVALKFYRKLDAKVLYTTFATANAITGLEKNALFVYYMSNETTNFPTVQMSARMRFIDN